jgi:drug/metabolite transporter (DMT)-like permease
MGERIWWLSRRLLLHDARGRLHVSRRGWALFIAMGFIWGVPYLLIKIAVKELSPSTLVLARTSLASLVLLPIALARGDLREVFAAWRPLVAFAVIEIMVPWVLLGIAEQRLASSLTGLLLASVPLVGAALAIATRSDDRLDRRRLAGLLVGLAGVAALVGFEVGGGDVGAVAAVAVVAVCYASGPLILARWLSHLPGLGVITLSMVLTALVYLPLGVVQAPSSWPGTRVALAVAGLAVLCTAIAFLVFFELIAEVGPTRSTVITYLNPAVAVLLGVTLLDEKFSGATAAGFALILTGSVLATRRSRAVVAPTVAAIASEEPCMVAEP